MAPKIRLLATPFRYCISTFLEFNNSISVMAKKGRMVALNASPINTSNTGSSRNKNNMDGNVNQSKYARRSEEHTSELQSRFDLVCRLLLEKKKKNTKTHI